jgi:hypothetical protein
MTSIAGNPAVPRPVTAAVAVWLAAVGAGVAETFVHLTEPDPPSGTAVLLRFTIYAAVCALVLALRTGRNAVRWALAVLLGVFGTLSLVVEPVLWLVGGGDATAFLVAADGPTLAVVALRALHVLAVAVACALMFHPFATAWFRRGS